MARHVLVSPASPSLPNTPTSQQRQQLSPSHVQNLSSSVTHSKLASNYFSHQPYRDAVSSVFNCSTSNMHSTPVDLSHTTPRQGSNSFLNQQTLHNSASRILDCSRPFTVGDCIASPSVQQWSSTIRRILTPHPQPPADTSSVPVTLSSSQKLSSGHRRHHHDKFVAMRRCRERPALMRDSPSCSSFSISSTSSSPPPPTDRRRLPCPTPSPIRVNKTPTCFLSQVPNNITNTMNMSRYLQRVSDKYTARQSSPPDSPLSSSSSGHHAGSSLYSDPLSTDCTGSTAPSHDSLAPPTEILRRDVSTASSFHSVSTYTTSSIAQSPAFSPQPPPPPPRRYVFDNVMLAQANRTRTNTVPQRRPVSSSSRMNSRPPPRPPRGFRYADADLSQNISQRERMMKAALIAERTSAHNTPSSSPCMDSEFLSECQDVLQDYELRCDNSLLKHQNRLLHAELYKSKHHKHVTSCQAEQTLSDLTRKLQGACEANRILKSNNETLMVTNTRLHSDKQDLEKSMASIASKRPTVMVQQFGGSSVTWKMYGIRQRFSPSRNMATSHESSGVEGAGHDRWCSPSIGREITREGGNCCWTSPMFCCVEAGIREIQFDLFPFGAPGTGSDKKASLIVRYVSKTLRQRTYFCR
eukprot:GHVQ01034421.1.p1 GENE.GHVQ01034421.1~~GHVQ01034421.1.p1  ORF type:complete len:638 (+),score=71.95 GHVQ01034421.1:629-2542(+)